MFSGKRTCSSVCSPHGVQHGPVLHDTEQFVGRRHVVRDGLLGISEERVRYPDLLHHAVVEAQDLSGAFELEPLVNPHLAEEHVHGVILPHRTQQKDVTSATTGITAQNFHFKPKQSLAEHSRDCEGLSSSGHALRGDMTRQ